MRRHITLDLDQGLLHEAAAALGTTGAIATVHAALAEVVAHRRRAMLARHDFPDLTPEGVAAVRAARHATRT
jgi:Arc/MetJ family transcription regulator